MLWYRSFSLLAVVWCFVVVVFGAYVRLSDAGLGCPDWPGCYGHLGVPAAAHELSAAQEKFPERPVETPKAWKEMIHRYLASTLGLIIVGLAFAGLRLPPASAPRALPWILVGLVIFQGVLGMWTVTWQLKPLVVTAHLLGGMTTLALLMWTYLKSREAKGGRPEASEKDREFRSERHVALELASFHVQAGQQFSRGLRFFAGVALFVLVVQIFLGGWTSTNYAALACPDLPTCHGRWLPETDAGEAFTLWRGLGINYEHGVLDNRARVTIHFFHRLGAIVTVLVLLALGGVLFRQASPQWRMAGGVLIAALTLQVGLGLGIVKLQLPLALAAAHNAGAAMLLLTLVSINYLAWRGRPVLSKIP